ncbi:MAG TPA: hypothetical protein VFU15_05055, partial [Bacteroidia bacterium]|nr:hypothetical protein [Bacteroidia bacterium]
MKYVLYITFASFIFACSCKQTSGRSPLPNANPEELAQSVITCLAANDTATLMKMTLTESEVNEKMSVSGFDITDSMMKENNARFAVSLREKIGSTFAMLKREGEGDSVVWKNAKTVRVEMPQEQIAGGFGLAHVFFSSGKKNAEFYFTAMRTKNGWKVAGIFSY